MEKEIKLNVISSVYDNVYDYYEAKLEGLKTLLAGELSAGETNIKNIKTIECYIDIYTKLKNDLFSELMKIKELICRE